MATLEKDIIRELKRTRPLANFNAKNTMVSPLLARVNHKKRPGGIESLQRLEIG